MAHRGTIIKPSIGFLARFFWEGWDRRLSLKGNALQPGKTRKGHENTKKSAKYFPWDPCFSAKTAGILAADFASC
jgi:hypothetical protein